MAGTITPSTEECSGNVFRKSDCPDISLVSVDEKLHLSCNSIGEDK